MSWNRWRYVSATEADGIAVPRGVYDPDGRIRLLVLRDTDHEALNAFGRLVADLLNTHDNAVKAIADYDASKGEPS